jgi:hypothetical protein
MNDLHAWLSQPHQGFRTFHIFQQELETLSGDEPEQRALCRLLTYLVGSYIEDEEPLPVAVADRLYQRPLDLAASLDFRASARNASDSAVPSAFRLLRFHRINARGRTLQHD